MPIEHLTPVFEATEAPEAQTGISNIPPKGKGVNIRAITGDGLTLKEHTFVIEYVRTASGTEAALRAWGEDFDRRVKDRVRDRKTPNRPIERIAEDRSSQLLGREDIRLAIRAELEKQATPEYVRSKIKGLADTAKSQETQLKAAIALGKFLSMGEAKQVPQGVQININLPEAKSVPIREVIAEECND